VTLAPRVLLAGAAACAVAFAVLLALVYGSDQVRAVDVAGLRGFLGLQGPTVSWVVAKLIPLGNPVPVVLIAAVLAAVALARGRPRVAALVVALIAVTSVSSQALKALLAFPREEAAEAGASIGVAAFPSGHATAAMSLAIALVVVVPSRMRPAAALVGTGLALGVSYSLVVTGGHFPSDVIGGFLLASATALVLIAALARFEARHPAGVVGGRVAPALGRWVDRAAAVGLAATLAIMALAACVVTVVVLAFRLPDLVDYAQAHTVFFAVAAAVAVSAIVLLGALAAAVSRRRTTGATRETPVS